MQSYQLHIVPQHLKRRHPYLQPPFKARYDPTEVNKAVFDRAIPKFIEILLTESLPQEKYTSALMTLNEMASDEVQKSNMIEQGCVGLASAFCHCKHISIRREATILLGLLMSTNQGIHQLNQQSYDAINKLLFDQQLEVREAVSWAICRVVLSRIGTNILCRQKIIKTIVSSFLHYSQKNELSEQYFLLYLLRSFSHILSSDTGIIFFVGCGLTARLKSLTKTQCYSKQNNLQFHSLSLAALSCMAMNQAGKQQLVHQNVIQDTSHFLASSIHQQIAHQVTLIMFTAIHLTGKKQCIYKAEKLDTDILIKLCKLLQTNVQEAIKNDVRQTLKMIAQEQDGFLAIADYMSRGADLSHIQQIFGARIIVPLALLLPKLKQLPEPPVLPTSQINEYKAYAKAINHFIKEPGAVKIALTQCVDLANKMVLFMSYRGDKVLQEGTANTLLALVDNHPYSKHIVKEFIGKYGEVEHKITKTTISCEVGRFEKLRDALGI